MKVFPLKEGDEKRMPIRLTQNGAALSWTPTSVTFLIARQPGGTSIEREAVAGATAADWYYDWTAADYDVFPGGYKYDCEVVVVKPAGVAPGGPETAPTIGRLQISIEKPLS